MLRSISTNIYSWLNCIMISYIQTYIWKLCIMIVVSKWFSNIDFQYKLHKLPNDRTICKYLTD